ncbi:Ribosomal S13S15 domain protein [Methanohalobium evestigatum Z-7303]|uniref:Small ribosomal subunit protein uS15 n=2 Tax=root TaxID=1 RepID=D7E6B3_METEZ|nr:30S ribosomal protein S15 [Methanohalobium evestigatum]ADI73135.1 Ribosomal S13S15 domain protein [Methanohalobium evestigatum Z-7303]AGF93233.1 30S ribosomal protein S15P [uncultured organism]
MAKMHTRRKGQSGSTRPMRNEVPEWSPLDVNEIEQKVIELWKNGYSSSEIGMILRDIHGVPDVKLATGKKITSILVENNEEFHVPEDLYNLVVKAIRIRKHLDINPHDIHNKRSLQNIEAKIRRLAKYYRSNNVLPSDWKYKPETAEMLITR